MKWWSWHSNHRCFSSFCHKSKTEFQTQKQNQKQNEMMFEALICKQKDSKFPFMVTFSRNYNNWCWFAVVEDMLTHTSLQNAGNEKEQTKPIPIIRKQIYIVLISLNELCFLTPRCQAWCSIWTVFDYKNMDLCMLYRSDSRRLSWM